MGKPTAALLLLVALAGALAAAVAGRHGTRAGAGAGAPAGGSGALPGAAGAPTAHAAETGGAPARGSPAGPGAGGSGWPSGSAWDVPLLGAAAAPGATLAPMGDGSVLYSDGTGRFFVLRPSPAGVSLAAVLALRHDPHRFATDPGRRAPHGYYLDDLAPEAERALAASQEAFKREVRSGSIDADANARGEALARTIFAAGDATFLLDALKDDRYGARRAAAFVLGAHGYAQARPVLEEVLSETAGDGAARARRALDGLAGSR